MLHPVTVHFAMVLPLVASVLGVFYILTRNKGVSTFSLWATFLAAIAMAIAWYTGSEAGPAVYDYLSENGQKELLEHKRLGLYLALSLCAIFLLQILGSKLGKFIIEALAIALLLTATLVTFVQGNNGGKIVYEHGMPFKALIMEELINDAVAEVQEAQSADEKVEIYEEAVESIRIHSKDLDKLYGTSKNPAIEEAE